MFRNLLLVCVGNICRSPLAEGLMRQRIAAGGREMETASAGLGALPGVPADPLAQLVAADHGIDLSEHRSRPIDPDLVRWADLILVMELVHRQQLIGLAPAAAGKTFLLGHWTRSEVPDPYGEDRTAFEDAFELIEEGVDAWLARV